MDHIGSDNPAVTEITATVMVQTETALKRLMESTQLTIGEVIDRLALQMTPRDKEAAAALASERVAMCFSQLPKAQSMAAYLEFLTMLASILSPKELDELCSGAEQRRIELMQELEG